MAIKETIIALIILDSRLSKEQASATFKDLNCDQLLSNHNLDEYIRRGLTFLWNYETTLASQDMKKRAKFLATNLIRRLNKILRVTNIEERKKLLNAFITELAGSDMPFLDKPSIQWTESEKRKTLKYYYKYALNERELAKIINVERRTIIDWIAMLNDNDALKQGLRTLGEYNQDKWFDKGYYQKK